MGRDREREREKGGEETERDQLHELSVCPGRVTNSPASDADGDSIGAALFSKTRIWNLAVRNGHTDELGGQLVSTEKSTIDHIDGKAPHPHPQHPHILPLSPLAPPPG